MDPTAFRDESIKEARRLGYQVSADLPLLDFDMQLRTQDEVVRRCLARYAAVAVAYGFDRDAAWDWLKREALTDALAPSERSYLDRRSGVEAPQAGVESLWALCWALGMVGALDFALRCGDNLIGLFPDLKSDDRASVFFAKARLREPQDIAASLDLAYCLHWAITEAGLSRVAPPGQLPPYVVVERRRALEWLVGDDDWDEVSLDT